jgi:hypothetical protein
MIVADIKFDNVKNLCVHLLIELKLLDCAYENYSIELGDQIAQNVAQPIFVEQSSTKECSHQPPPPKNGNKCKYFSECAHIRA